MAVAAGAGGDAVGAEGSSVPSVDDAVRSCFKTLIKVIRGVLYQIKV
jgi:hypothetical protein